MLILVDDRIGTADVARSLPIRVGSADHSGSSVSAERGVHERVCACVCVGRCLNARAQLLIQWLKQLCCAVRTL